ncbi:phosphopantetheine-binding protein [Rathayibacter tritici]
MVAAAFARELSCDEVPVDVSFFDLGGDSMSAMRTMRHLGELVGRRLPTRLLFENQTARELATALRT